MALAMTSPTDASAAEIGGDSGDLILVFDLLGL
jgi:hypothetical protein